jgi:hypothetical protein
MSLENYMHLLLLLSRDYNGFDIHTHKHQLRKDQKITRWKHYVFVSDGGCPVASDDRDAI